MTLGQARLLRIRGCRLPPTKPDMRTHLPHLKTPGNRSDSAQLRLRPALGSCREPCNRTGRAGWGGSSGQACSLCPHRAPSCSQSGQQERPGWSWIDLKTLLSSAQLSPGSQSLLLPIFLSPVTKFFLFHWLLSFFNRRHPPVAFWKRRGRRHMF